jgi:thioredoxin 1
VKATAKWFVLAAVAAAVVAVLIAKKGPAAAPERVAPVAQAAARPLPRLVDLGAGKCIPCKQMAPILEALKTEYAGRMDVQFIDVWQDPAAARPFAIHMIPTQIFFAADGRELARHEGFIGKDEILAHWSALGIEL